MREISLTGRILKKRYFVLEQIGSGGDGRLYLARDMELGTLRAVKVLPLEKKREAGLMRLLEHPSIPVMIDFVLLEDCCCLVMEFVRGKSLQQMLGEGCTFSVGERIELGIVLTEVLEYLHSRKPPVFYGDLKPENLMLSDTGKLYLVDFGSAVFGYSEFQRVCSGTRGFASPEQYQGKITAVSDVYALGKTMQALAGRQQLRDYFLAPEFALFMEKCCRVSEERRFQSMKEVREKLLRIREQRKKHRYKKLLAVFGMAALLGLGSCIFFPKKDFYVELTEITERFWDDSNLTKTNGGYAEMEEQLKTLMSGYPGEGRQSKILMLLAATAELQGEEKRAQVYYEQCLLYEPECVQAYGEYGCFLWRIGQVEESLRLWDEYMQKVGTMDENAYQSGGYAFLKWEEMVDEWKKMGQSGKNTAASGDLDHK